MTLTPHFTLEEFTCHDGTPYPPEWIETRLKPLCEDLEVIREVIGGPLYVTCGYRTEAYNKAIYREMGKPATKNSQHVQGLAADLVSRTKTAQVLHDIILKFIKEKKIRDGGLGLYHWGCHYDHGPIGRRWLG